MGKDLSIQQQILDLSQLFGKEAFASGSYATPFWIPGILRNVFSKEQRKAYPSGPWLSIHRISDSSVDVQVRSGMSISSSLDSPDFGAGYDFSKGEKWALTLQGSSTNPRLWPDRGSEAAYVITEVEKFLGRAHQLHCTP